MFQIFYTLKYQWIRISVLASHGTLRVPYKRTLKPKNFYARVIERLCDSYFEHPYQHGSQVQRIVSKIVLSELSGHGLIAKSILYEPEGHRNAKPF